AVPQDPPLHDREHRAHQGAPALVPRRLRRDPARRSPAHDERELPREAGRAARPRDASLRDEPPRPKRAWRVAERALQRARQVTLVREAGERRDLRETRALLFEEPAGALEIQGPSEPSGRRADEAPERARDVDGMDARFGGELGEGRRRALRAEALDDAAEPERRPRVAAPVRLDLREDLGARGLRVEHAVL